MLVFERWQTEHPAQRDSRNPNAKYNYFRNSFIKHPFLGDVFANDFFSEFSPIFSPSHSIMDNELYFFKWTKKRFPYSEAWLDSYYQWGEVYYSTWNPVQLINFHIDRFRKAKCRFYQASVNPLTCIKHRFSVRIEYVCKVLKIC